MKSMRKMLLLFLAVSMIAITLISCKNNQTQPGSTEQSDTSNTGTDTGTPDTSTTGTPGTGTPDTSTTDTSNTGTPGTTGGNTSLTVPTKDETLFYSSFEKSSDYPKSPTLYGDYVKNIALATSLPKLSGNITSTVDTTTLKGSPDNGNESKDKLFDNNVETKFLSKLSPTVTSPAIVSFQLKSAQTVTAYLLASANDEQSRDPRDWKFFGSNDGTTWTKLDEQSGQMFSGRFESRVYTFTNTVAYTYYKLEITKNSGSDMIQFASFELGTGKQESSVETSALQTSVVVGPTSNDGCQSGTAWDGKRSLKVVGQHMGTADAYCKNILFSDLSIVVDEYTSLSYMIFPSSYAKDGYDFDYMNMHFIIDLEFSDGTFLSQLSAVDQYGNKMTPDAQAKSECLYTKQWNSVVSNIGSVAKGKTISKILLYYACDDANGGVFSTFIDEIAITRKPPVVKATHLSDYINILRGSNSTTGYSRGLTCPAVSVPNGFNFYTPCTTAGSSTPYYYSATSNSLCHISVEHMPSTWVGDWGTWQFMANTSLNNVTSYTNMNTTNRSAKFSHDNEIAKAHYYSVIFDEDDKRAGGVQIEITPTDHAAYVRMTYPSDAENVNVIFDCERASGFLSFLTDNKSFKAYSDHKSNGSTRLFVYGEFVTPYESAKVHDNKSGFVTFPSGTTEVLFKFATSYISYDQAKKNLELEIAESDTFSTVFTKAQSIWDKLLETVKIENASEDELVTFYSCMYRLYIYPTNYSENTGTAQNPVMSYASPYQNGKLTNGQLYVNNGFWDTYRTTWAAYALLTPEKDTDYLNGLVQHYIDSGRIPRWIAPAGANSMVGTSSDVIIGDAIVKKIQFNSQNAYLSALKNASVVSTNLTGGGRSNLETSIFLGYTSLESGEAFSWSVEGYVNDYGIAQAALALGNTDEYKYYMNRALNYTLLYNPTNGWFMGRDSNGNYRNNSLTFNGANWGWGGDYTETNAWNMSFPAVYDVNGMINLYGGKEAFIAKLDALFGDDVRNTISGGIHEMIEAREVRIGQYHHSNQPSHHLAYLYDYAGAPYKTAEVVREILSHCYVGSEIGQGYIGDEDNGEMSAWYILSSLGFYPDNMGSGEYTIGSPLFDKVTIDVGSGKTLTITANNNSKENIYIQSVTVNGQSYNKTYFTHEMLVAGGTIVFEMGDRPSQWGTSADSVPTSITTGTDIAKPATDLTRKLTIIKSLNKTANSELAVTGTLNSYANLFDDTSSTVLTLSDDKTSFYYYNKDGKTVKIYTLTSSGNAATAPEEFSLWASDDGETWTCIDDRKDETFAWGKYTRPFAIDDQKQGVYKYYRLDVSAGSLAEIELLGN